VRESLHRFSRMCEKFRIPVKHENNSQSQPQQQQRQRLQPFQIFHACPQSDRMELELRKGLYQTAIRARATDGTDRARFGWANATNVVKFTLAAGVTQSMTVVCSANSRAIAPRTGVRLAAKSIVNVDPDIFGARS
jgi:hypothetical protein